MATEGKCYGCGRTARLANYKGYMLCRSCMIERCNHEAAKITRGHRPMSDDQIYS